MKVVEGERLLENLGGSVAVACIEGESRPGTSVELDLRAVCHGFVDVFILPEEGVEIEDGEINLVAELIVVVGGGEGVLAAKKILLNPAFECSILFGLQIGVGNNSRPAGKRFFQPRLFDPGGV